MRTVGPCPHALDTTRPINAMIVTNPQNLTIHLLTRRSRFDRAESRAPGC